MKLKIFLIYIFPILLISQNNTSLPNDIKWTTQSEEYKELCKQIYKNAWEKIERHIFDSNYQLGMKNRVIVMDLDETVLDNSKYQIELNQKSESYTPITWNKFVKKEISNLVPGAKVFINKYKNIDNAKIIYISNRDASTLEATINNMKKLGVFYEDDIYLLKQDKNDSKIIRRIEVLNGSGRMKKHGQLKVIAYFGDAIGDFPLNKNYTFSINKFIFPNTMYGAW